MGRKRLYALVAGLAAIAVVVLLLAFVVIPGSSTGIESTTVAATSGSPSEGITVHGHWTVEVLNPDGSLAEHREFENTVSSEGKSFLTSLLARSRTIGRWSIMLDGSPAHPCLKNGISDVCYVCEPSFPLSASSYFKNLIKSMGASVLTLSGSITIASATSISFVSTIIEYCSGAMSPISCGDTTTVNEERQMTSTGVSPAIAVQAGQQVQVTVEINIG